MMTGCATYHAQPLAQHARLASSLSELDTEVPATTRNDPPQRINVRRPLTIAEIGLLAILNDPDLRSEWGEIGVAQADLLQASLLPNPSATLGFAALLGGPGSTPSYAASLSQDIASLVTYRARVQAARTHVGEVNAALLWQEWQVAQKAQLLALNIYYGERSLALTTRTLRLVSVEVQQVQAATAAGNLALTAVAPLLVAQASAEQALVTLNVAQIKQWQSLNALLGLEPNVRFDIVAPELLPPPSPLDPLISRLPQRRPDLVALQLGYGSTEANLRAAILGQFPAFLLGGTWGSDTTDVRSAGPTVTFDLPIFNRNQGKIAETRATRLVLRQQYLARLDGAVGTVRGIAGQEYALSGYLRLARQAADAAQRLARTARNAYAQGNLDQRALTDYETTALQRDLEVIDLQRSLGEDRIALNAELGLGLPVTRIVPSNRASVE
jgi:outer membrane protein TolC